MVTVTLNELGAKLYNDYWRSKYLTVPTWINVSPGFVVHMKLKPFQVIFGTDL